MVPTFSDVAVRGPGFHGTLEIVGAMLAAIVGALLGGWLSHYSTMSTTRAKARTVARHHLAELYMLLWPPTRFAQLHGELEAIDADLQAARVAPELRAALSRVAIECWNDGSIRARSSDDPGISTKLLEAYRQVRTAILLQLLPRGRRNRDQRRIDALLVRVEDLIAENMTDRSTRFRHSALSTEDSSAENPDVDYDKRTL